MSKSLFRKEAIDAQREKFLGETGAAQPVHLWVYTLLTVIIAAMLIAVAVWGQYTRRERVQGYLASEVGAAPLMVSDAGVIAELMVKEGDEVAAGAPIARISVDRSGTNAAASDETVVHELGTRKTLLEQEREQTLLLGQQQVDQLKKRVVDLQKEIAQADREIELQQQRLASSRIIAKRYTELENDRFISDIVVRQKLDDVTDQEIKIQTLRRQRAALEKDLASARLDIPAISLRTGTQSEQIARQISEVAQSVAERDVRREQDVKREMLVRAPFAGTITNIALSRGQTVASDTPLATLLPKDSALHAELLVPTRAIGFVHPGQDVSLRYEAFPYERFGQYRGAVTSVGRTIWSQGESVGPLSVREPVYRIVVHLASQNIASSGQEFPLRAGMVVSADLLMEKRTILEWLFQPVLQLRERMR